MQRISRDDRATADADYRQAAGGDVAVDGSSPKARRLTGLIDAVSDLRGIKLIVPHVLVPIVHRRPYAHRVGKAFMGHDLSRIGDRSTLNFPRGFERAAISSSCKRVSGPVAGFGVSGSTIDSA